MLTGKERTQLLYVWNLLKMEAIRFNGSAQAKTQASARDSLSPTLRQGTSLKK